MQEWYALQPDVVIVLLDVDSKRFELVVMDNIQTVQDCLQQIPLRATDLFLKQQQQYIGLCDPMVPHKLLVEHEITANATQMSLSSSQVLVAVPNDRTAHECAALARSILATRAVVQTVRVVVLSREHMLCSYLLDETPCCILS